MCRMSGVGYLCAILSACFNGTFAVPFKLESVKKYQIAPTVFQFYVAIGVFISSWLAVPFLPYNHAIADDDQAGTSFMFSWLGCVAGALFVFAISCSFLAVELIGLALAQGIWGGVAIVVSFLWGVIGFAEYPKTPGLSAAGVFLLICGIFGIAFCEQLSTVFWERKNNDLDANKQVVDNALWNTGLGRRSFNIDDQFSLEDAEPVKKRISSQLNQPLVSSGPNHSSNFYKGIPSVVELIFM